VQRELTTRLGGAFESVEELMHAVLDISRLDSQRIEFHRRLGHRRVFDRQPLEQLVQRHRAAGLRLSFVPTSAVVDSGSTFLRRLAQKLVSNALKYTEGGGGGGGVRRGGKRGGAARADGAV
ncbi:ATPase, partial [Paracoccus sanguinis]